MDYTTTATFGKTLRNHAEVNPAVGTKKDPSTPEFRPVTAHKRMASKSRRNPRNKPTGTLGSLSDTLREHLEFFIPFGFLLRKTHHTHHMPILQIQHPLTAALHQAQ